jgi:hypothetical protein
MKYRCHPANAPGPFYVVEGGCLFCDAALAEAPSLMEYRESHCVFRCQPRTDEELSQAISAVNVCCTLAVRYAGNDKTILDRIVCRASCDVLPESEGLFNR